jgi:hypothetical protein
LETENTFSREQIGDIAWCIASTYLHYQYINIFRFLTNVYLNHNSIRSSSKDFLKRSILFFEAIHNRGYFDQIKDTEYYNFNFFRIFLKIIRKYRHFLLCFSFALILANSLKQSKDIIKQITEIDHPIENSQSFILSQSSHVLNDVEVIIYIILMARCFTFYLESSSNITRRDCI